MLSDAELNRMDELTDIVRNYTQVFNLDNEDIRVGLSGKSNAFIEWVKEEKYWGVYLLPSDNDYTPIHELGHVLLSRLTSYPYFAKSGHHKTRFFEELLILTNHIVDCYVDYNAIQYEGVYELYIEDRHLWSNVGKGKVKGEPISLAHSYKTLIGHYLSLKLINKEKNRRDWVDVKNYLKNAKRFIIQAYSNIDFDFDSLENKLDLFDKLKDIKRPKSIINFIYTILNETKLWERKEIRKQLKTLFP